MKISETVKTNSVKELFCQMAAEVPFLRLQFLDAVEPPLSWVRQLPVDLAAVVYTCADGGKTSGNGSYLLLIHSRESGAPSAIYPTLPLLEHSLRNVQSDLRRYSELIASSSLDVPPLVGVCTLLVAPYISTEVAHACRERGIGFLDRAGNCHLTFGTIFLHREGRPNPIRRDPALRTLFSPRAERVLRVLLGAPLESWKTQSLASKAQVSLGQIDKVKKALESRNVLAHAGQGGIRLAAPDTLLRLWATEHAARAPERVGVDLVYYSLAAPSDDWLEEKMIRLREHIGSGSDEPFTGIALSGLSAAARLAPYARSPRLTAYVRAEYRETVVREWDLTPVESGANVVLSVPADEGAFYGTLDVGSVPVLSPIQVYLDLYRLGGRAREGADHLLKQVLRPSWEASDFVKAAA
jgi:hypothetical protein